MILNRRGPSYPPDWWMRQSEGTLGTTVSACEPRLDVSGRRSVFPSIRREQYDRAARQPCVSAAGTSGRGF
jgi:hypothetical protein